jgi:tetratricopeptide (TPR) repeat protein
MLPAVFSLACLAVHHAELGMFVAGRALGEEGLQIAEEVAHPCSLMWAYHGMGVVALRQGDLPGALPLLERALGICQAADLLNWFPRIAAPLGAAYTLTGRVADAVSLFTQAMEQNSAIENVWFEMVCNLRLGEALVLAGRPAEAQAHAARGLALTRAHQGRNTEAYALWILGKIAAHGAPSERTQAAGHYQQALVLTDALGMRPLAAHCHLGLGTLYCQMEPREGARTALTTAIAMYRTIEMTWWLPEAEALLAQTA